MKPSWQCSRNFDLSDLFPVQFGQQVNQVQKISHLYHSHPELIMEDWVECLLEVHKAYIKRLLVCKPYASVSEIRDLVSCPISLSKSCLFVCNFCFGLHSDPFQYDPKKDLACVWDKSNCSVICTLFKITFPEKWEKCGERPFLWPLTSFPDHHTYSVHYVQCCLSSCFEQFCWDLIRTCGFVTCSQYSCSIPFPSSSWYRSSQYLFHLSAIFASRWVDTLQTWQKLSSHWFDYLKELPGISFWVRCSQFHAHAFQLQLFIHTELSLYLSLQFLISTLIFVFCLPSFTRLLQKSHPISISFSFATWRIQSFLWLLPAWLTWYLSRDLGLPHPVQPPVP